MLSLRRGRVTAILEEHDGLVRLEVDGAPCVAYPRLTGPVEVGDDVVVNVQARELELGSGGFDVLHVNLTRGLDLGAEDGAHVMKLPYTSLQFARRHGEEELELPESLDGMPVVACSLHSQVAPVCAALRGLRVAYVQLEGGALPVELSDSLRELRREGLLEQTIGSGACFGGDVDCVERLLRARGGARARRGRHRLRDRPRASSAREHGSGTAAWPRPPRSPRRARSAVDPSSPFGSRRATHASAIAASHTTARRCSRCPATRRSWPRRPTRPAGAKRATGLTLSHMGRGPDDDPAFFAAAYAAGVRARSLLG